MSLADWKDLMNAACADADHGPRCLNFHVNYTTKRGPDEECTVDNVSPPIGKKVTTGTRIRLKVSCETSESDTTQTDTDTTDNEQGPTDTDTTDNEQGPTEDEKGR